jgi:hypothetical protein
MKISVIYKKNYGVEMFYPANEWTDKFLSVLRPPSIRGKSFSRRQIDLLKELGFNVEISVQIYQ